MGGGRRRETSNILYFNEAQTFFLFFLICGCPQNLIFEKPAEGLEFCGRNDGENRMTVLVVCKITRQIFLVGECANGLFDKVGQNIDGCFPTDQPVIA